MKKPAQTAEEWAGLGYCEGHSKQMAVSLSEDRRLLIEEEYGYDGAAKHAIAALALHGEPFGFTWADVDALRFLATNEAHLKAINWADSPPEQLRGRALSLADRLATLLPPREP